MITHNMSTSPEYASWLAAKGRINNPNTWYYKYYGGRGITMCKEWFNSFERFYKGIYFNNAAKKWAVQININKRVKYLGLFENLNDAVICRKSAERNL